MWVVSLWQAFSLRDLNSYDIDMKIESAFTDISETNETIQHVKTCRNTSKTIQQQPLKYEYFNSIQRYLLI